MTVTSTAPVDVRPDPAGVRKAPAGRVAPPVPTAGPGLWATGAALAILGALLLGFVAEVGPLGHLRHERDRRVGYAELRDKLANATAPVGPTEAGAPVALLAIPQIGVREVVREATTADVLASGPGHRRDTVLPGQPGTSILMGRQAGYGGPFGHIGDLERGETFTVTTGQGEHAYRVLGVRRAGDPQPAKPTGDAGLLTLMTADGTPYMPRGVLQVDAELLSPAQQSGGRTPGRLAAEEAPMAGQASAWVPLILWGQALLLAAAALAWARVRWGRAHTWLVGFPVLAALALAVSDQAALLLPNLL
ncbi:sortase [Streptomyces sp. NBC_00555]|uniref:sortase n=1 Tax=Streptomyces sp. NBC_00555 TaxID=2903662 RepID=UPI00225BE00D|nr:sortase [Streptomyces sp. NBC_00555]MCX5013880.1 sortase [Streptomyces sp. NBC_00555]